MKIQPKSVTAQTGMLSKNPHSPTASIISWGIVVDIAVPTPTVVIIWEVIPYESIEYLSNLQEINSIKSLKTQVKEIDYQHTTSVCFDLFPSVHKHSIL